MKEVIITSSVLILAVMGLRLLFRGRVRHGLLYGAWLLVAVRLLVPVQFGSFDFSLLNRAESVTEVIGQIAVTPVSGQSQKEIRQEVELDYFVRGEDLMPQIQQILEQEKLRNPDMEIESVYEQIMEERPREEVFTPEAQTKIEETVQQRFTAPTLGEIAKCLWLAGMVGMAVWFGWVNVSLARKLRRSGKPYSVEGKMQVWVSDVVPSPCLFGLFRPKIWLTPGCLEEKSRLNHVLAHEMTHRRHMDHIWSLVRCFCLCVYWFNPLVWVAAWLSKRDCELACDEAALKRLGDDQRIAYGKTLVDLVAENIAPGQLLETATAMHETKKQMKARVSYIVKKPKVLAAAVVILVLTLAIVTGCSFGGQKETNPELNVPDPTEATEATQPTEATMPTETKPTETTKPTEPKISGLELLPEVPKTDTLQVKPEEMTAEDFVVTVYEKQANWTGGGYVSFRIPALLPISEDAIAVNNKIYDYVNGWVQFARESYESGESYSIAVDYTVYQKNDLVSLVLTRKKDEAIYKYAYVFDCKTGAIASPVRIAREYDPQLEYPQLLYAMCEHFNTENTIKGISTVWEGKSLYLDEDGVVNVRYGSGTQGAQLLSALNPSQYSLDDCYQWMFDFVRNGYKDEFSDILVEAFLDAPQTFLMQYIKKSSNFIPKKMWKAESELAYAVARTIMMDRDNSYLLRCGAYGIASNLLPENEQYAFLKEVYDAHTDDQNRLLPSGKELFNSLEGTLVYGRQLWRQIEMGYRTEVLDITWKVCYFETAGGVGLGEQYPIHARQVKDYEQFLNWVRVCQDDSFIETKTDVTNAQCPESFDAVCASITESLFEDNVLIWVDCLDIKDAAPKLIKVDYDKHAFFTNPYLVHMDCADRREYGNLVKYVILITIPKELYHEFPENYKDLYYNPSVWENFGCVVNGEFHCLMDY